MQPPASRGFDVTKLLLLQWPHPQWWLDLSHVLTCRDNHTIEGGSPVKIQVEAWQSLNESLEVLLGAIYLN